MRARPVLLLALTLLALLLLLSFTTEQPLVATAQSSYTVTFTTYLNLAPPVQLQPGDILAPHLYDWFFDAVDDHIVVPHSDVLNIAPGNQISIAMWAKFTGWQSGYSIGIPIDKSLDGQANYHWDFNSDYMRMMVHGGSSIRIVSVPHSLNTWSFYAMVLNGSWLGGYLNGELRASRNDVPASSGNTLNLFIGQSRWGSRRAEGFIASVLIHRRPLSSAEVRVMYNANVINASGLALFIDATFFNGTHYIDISGYGNHGVPYGGVGRVPAERTWLWVVRGLTSDPVVWLRFFPSGTIVVFSDGSSVVIDGPVNSVGLVESFAVDRTDIAYLLVPVPGTERSATMTVSPAYAYVQSRIEIVASWLSGVSNVTVLFPNGTLTWVNGTGAFTTGPVLVASVRAVPGSWINITYVPLPGFTGGTAELTICTELCSSVKFNVSYVPGYSLDLSVQPRTTVGTVPWYSIETNYTGTVELHNLNAYLNLTPPVPLQPGDILAPHLYDWFFDGVDDYLVVGLQPNGAGTPFTVYGWSEITISERVYPVWPKANALYSLFSVIGDWWSPEPATTYETDNRADYTRLFMNFATRREDGTRVLYSYNLAGYVNTWMHVARRFTSARELSYWVNGVRVAVWTVPSTEATILEWNPATASYPRRYQRFVLGANMEFGGWMTLYQSYLIIHRRALSEAEIQALNSGVVDANGLEIFIDATFTNGTHYFNLGRNPATIGAYNGVQRVPANTTWLWVIRGASTDPVVWLRFFPSGTIVVFRDGSRVVIDGPVNSVGLVESFAVNRTDIAYLLVPVPGTARSAALAVSPAYAYVQSRIE
ncbi:MAG: LamG domain-containing protein, partial [Thermofilaceae archaeon]